MREKGTLSTNCMEEKNREKLVFTENHCITEPSYARKNEPLHPEHERRATACPGGMLLKQINPRTAAKTLRAFGRAAQAGVI